MKCVVTDCKGAPTRRPILLVALKENDEAYIRAPMNNVTVCERCAVWLDAPQLLDDALWLELEAGFVALGIVGAPERETAQVEMELLPGAVPTMS